MPEPASLHPATLGRYEVVRAVGRGRLGVVYEARDPTLARTVALKAIDPAVAAAGGAADFERRFFEEARLAARLSHPGIVRCHDVGKDPASGTLFVVFEYLRGLTLLDRVKAGALRWPDAVEIVAKLARAIEYAHRSGLVHRGLAPGSVMLLESGEPKILDFAIAPADAAAPGLPLYLSPEQALGHAVDARTDIFSLGSILCTLLVGRDYFAADSAADVRGRILREDAPMLSRLVPGAPGALDDVVFRAMAKTPSARYETAGHLADDLEDILASSPPRHARPRPPAPPEKKPASILADALGVATQPYRPLAGGNARTPAPVPRGPRMVPPRVLLALAAGLGVAAVFAAFQLGRRLADRVPAASAPVTAAPTAARRSVSEPTALPTRREPVVVERKKTAAAPGPIAVAKSTLHVTIKHPIKRGRLRLLVDERLVLDVPLEAKEKKKLLAFKATEEEIEKTIDVDPGRHDLRVIVNAEDGERVQTMSGRFDPSATRELAIEVARRKKLSFVWKDAKGSGQ
jgi:serine/threonine-protein kinase